MSDSFSKQSKLIKMQSITGLQVGVLGTGLPALAAAHSILKAGHNPTLLDTDQGFARPGKTFSCRGGTFDQFLQPVTDRDSEVHALIGELGLEAKLQWHAEAGRRLFWPIRRRSRVATCVGLAKTIESELLCRSGLGRDPVSKAMDLLEFDHCIELRSDRGRRQFDAMITTLPIDEVEDMARGLIAQEIPRSQSSHRTLVNVVFISSTPLFRKYSTFVENSIFPFSLVTATTDVDSRLTVISVSGYSDAPGLELRILASSFLCENFSEFQPSTVCDVRVFQFEERVPVELLSEEMNPIPARVGESRLFLASPEIGRGLPVSMNTDLLLAKRAVHAFLEFALTSACGARPTAHAAGR